MDETTASNTPNGWYEMRCPGCETIYSLPKQQNGQLDTWAATAIMQAFAKRHSNCNQPTIGTHTLPKSTVALSLSDLAIALAQEVADSNGCELEEVVDDVLLEAIATDEDYERAEAKP